MKYILFLSASFLFFSCSSLLEEEPKAEPIIAQKIQEQEDCWNKGDLDCFMKHYSKDENLEFIGKSGLTKGWLPTLQNYEKSYPTPEKMGKLSFEIIKNEQIDFTTAHTIGKWQLLRKEVGDTLAGHFTLIWQKRKGEWVIISDHSS